MWLWQLLLDPKAEYGVGEEFGEDEVLSMSQTNTKDFEAYKSRRTSEVAANKVQYDLYSKEYDAWTKQFKAEFTMSRFVYPLLLSKIWLVVQHCLVIVGNKIFGVEIYKTPIGWIIKRLRYLMLKRVRRYTSGCTI